MRSPSWLGRANSLWLRRPRKMRRTASARGARRRLSPRQCLNLSSSISARPAAQVSAAATDLAEPVVVAAEGQPAGSVGHPWTGPRYG
jgi:hypothetical protein